MRTETRYFDNVFWSWRRYLRSELSSKRIYYNPPGQPKPTTVDQWLIFLTGTYDLALFTRSNPRILCIARGDRTGSELAGLATDVVNVLDNQPGEKRWVTFYDKTSGEVIGRIEVVDLSVSPNVPYATGIINCAIDIFTRIKTARNANA